MCGRFTLTSNMDTILYRFSAISTSLINNSPRYNIAPTMSTLVVVNNEKQNEIKEFKWGLIPFWSKDPTKGSKIINARSESITEKPSFQKLIKRKRCLIPSNGFFEWKTTGKEKQPFLIKPTNDEIFSFAGLWDIWQMPTGSPIYSYTIITTKANSTIKPIHDRMPVILNRAGENIWLDPKITESNLLISLLTPSTEDFTIYQVSSIVNSVHTQDPKCIKPL